jgi:hypothetical protein
MWFELQVSLTAHQLLFMRTRRVIFEAGFLTTIHNMMEVASERPYLGRFVREDYDA